MKLKIDWYKAFEGNRYHLPGSQGQGIYIVQSILVPLQAAVALISGKYRGDFEALKLYLSEELVTCESCGNTLTRSGDGHDKSKCELYKRAAIVLTSDANESERRMLQAEQKRLAAKLDQTTRELSSIASKI